MRVSSRRGRSLIEGAFATAARKSMRDRVVRSGGGRLWRAARLSYRRRRIPASEEEAAGGVEDLATRSSSVGFASCSTFTRVVLPRGRPLLWVAGHAGQLTVAHLDLLRQAVIRMQQRSGHSGRMIAEGAAGGRTGPVGFLTTRVVPVRAAAASTVDSEVPVGKVADWIEMLWVTAPIMASTRRAGERRLVVIMRSF